MRPVVLALAVVLWASTVMGQCLPGGGIVVRRYPGPVTRYDWRPNQPRSFVSPVLSGYWPVGGCGPCYSPCFGRWPTVGWGGNLFSTSWYYPGGWSVYPCPPVNYGCWPAHGGYWTGGWGLGLTAFDYASAATIPAWAYAGGLYESGPLYGSWSYVPQRTKIAPLTSGRDLLPELAAPLRMASLSAPMRSAPAATPLSVSDSEDALRRSTRFVEAGDVQLRRGNYLAAGQEYRRAMAAAPAEGVPYFRLGFTLAAQRRGVEAAARFRDGLARDPQWPQHGESLDALFGSDAAREKQFVLQRVVSWVRDDVRDPERAFVLGVLLHFDGRREMARTLFESAVRLDGDGPHVAAFLRAADANAQMADGASAAPADSRTRAAREMELQAPVVAAALLPAERAGETGGTDIPRNVLPER